jgi:hypothetical protein
MPVLSAIDPIIASEEYALRGRVGRRSWALHVRWLIRFMQNLLPGYTAPSIDTLASLVLISNFELDAQRIDSESTSLRGMQALNIVLFRREMVRPRSRYHGRRSRSSGPQYPRSHQSQQHGAAETRVATRLGVPASVLRPQLIAVMAWRRLELYV